MKALFNTFRIIFAALQEGIKNGRQLYTRYVPFMRNENKWINPIPVKKTSGKHAVRKSYDTRVVTLQLFDTSFACYSTYF